MWKGMMSQIFGDMTDPTSRMWGAVSCDEVMCVAERTKASSVHIGLWWLGL